MTEQMLAAIEKRVREHTGLIYCNDAVALVEAVRERDAKIETLQTALDDLITEHAIVVEERDSLNEDRQSLIDGTTFGSAA